MNLTRESRRYIRLDETEERYIRLDETEEKGYPNFVRETGTGSFRYHVNERFISGKKALSWGCPSIHEVVHHEVVHLFIRAQSMGSFPVSINIKEEETQAKSFLSASILYSYPSVSSLPMVPTSKRIQILRRVVSLFQSWYKSRLTHFSPLTKGIRAVLLMDCINIRLKVFPAFGRMKKSWKVDFRMQFPVYLIRKEVSLNETGISS